MNLKRKFLSAVLAAVCGINVCMSATSVLTASAVEKVPGYDNVDNYMSDSIINGYVSLESGESTEAYGLYDPESTSLYTYEKLCDNILTEAGIESSEDFMQLNPELLGDVSLQQVYEQFILYNINTIGSESTYVNKTGKYMLSLFTELKETGLAKTEEDVASILESTSESDNTKALAALKKLGYDKELSDYKNIVSKLNTQNAYDYFMYISFGLALNETHQDNIDLLNGLKEVAADNEDFCKAIDSTIPVIDSSYNNAYFEENMSISLYDSSSELESSTLNIKDIFTADETSAKMYLLLQDTVNQYYDEALKNFYTDYSSTETQADAEDFHSAYASSMLFQSYMSINAAEFAADILTETDIKNLERDAKNFGIQITIIDKWYENYLIYTDTEDVEIDFTKDVVEYNGHYYKVFNNSISWIYAKEYCELMGGHLATITDADEQKIVEGVAQACTEAENFWIGGYLSKETDEWTWVDDTPFEYTNWDQSQPDFHQGEEFYIRFTNDDIHYESWTAAMGKWNDCANEASGDNDKGDAVSIQTFAFICEWDSDDFQLDYLPGDANNDGKVNVRDAAFIAAALAKNETSKLTIAADFNKDTKINVRDAAAIAKYLATDK